MTWYRFSFFVEGEPREFGGIGDRLEGAVARSLGIDAARAAAVVLFKPESILIDNPHLVVAEAPDALFEVYATGLVYCAVCTTLDVDAASVRVNESHPSGIESRWQVADEPFPTGEPNPHPCAERSGCRHWLFVL